MVQSLNNAAEMNYAEVTAGFDGFVDNIAKVVKKVDSHRKYTYFQYISEYGAFIQDKKEKSCSIELEEQSIKIGGNMPIFANSIGNLGIKVNCIGAMGYPEIHDAFKDMSPSCSLYSVAKPGYCTALEFKDGKIMMATNNGLESMTWEAIKTLVGLDKIRRFFSSSNIIGMFNWSEIYTATSIWEGIIQDILLAHQPDKKQVMLFDLSDCSKRDKSDISNAIKLIGKFREHYCVLLSLNENETQYVYEALYADQHKPELESMGDRIYRTLCADILIVRHLKYSIAWNGQAKHRSDNLNIESPKLSTGGGDNFNAGLCFAWLLGLDMPYALILAGAASSFYIKYGFSANKNELMNFLNQWEKTL